jgi:hypothetical protein
MKWSPGPIVFYNKSKVVPLSPCRRQGEGKYSDYSFLSGREMGLVVTSRLGRALPRGKNLRYPLDRRLGELQSWSGHRGFRKHTMPLSGIETRLFSLIPWRKNPKVHHRTHNSPPLVTVLSQSNPIHIPQANLPKIFPVLRLCQVIRPVPRLCVVIRNKYWVLRGRIVSPPNPQAGGPPTIGCPRLIIQHIRSYPPCLEAVSSIRNPKTRHAVVTVDPLNMGLSSLQSDTILTELQFLSLL